MDAEDRELLRSLLEDERLLALGLVVESSSHFAELKK
jgi:hypothetical protein